MRLLAPLLLVLIAALPRPAAAAGDVIVPSRAVGLTHNCANYYPPSAQRANESGDVMVGYVVTAQGSITGVTVLKSSGYTDLDTAAVLCVQTHFQSTPATRNGIPIASRTRIIIRFLLEGSPQQRVAQSAGAPQRVTRQIARPDIDSNNGETMLAVLALIAVVLFGAAEIASRFITRGPRTQ